jgi:DNA-binding Lrp family transcriptional regulator
MIKRKPLTEFAKEIMSIITASKHGAYTSQIANVLGASPKRIRNNLETLREKGLIKSASVGNHINVWLPLDGVPDPLAGTNYTKAKLEKKEYAKRKPIDMGKPKFVPVRNGTTSSKNWTPPQMECARADGNQFLSIGTVEQGREIPRMRPVIICAGARNQGPVTAGRPRRLS